MVLQTNFYLLVDIRRLQKLVTRDLLVTKEVTLMLRSLFQSKIIRSLKFKTGTRLLKLTDDKNDSGIQGFLIPVVKQNLQHLVFSKLHRRLFSRQKCKITSENKAEQNTCQLYIFQQKETRWHDPLAQTFLIEDPNLEGGAYLSKIDLFFFRRQRSCCCRHPYSRKWYSYTKYSTILKVVKQPEDNISAMHLHHYIYV